MNASDSGSSPAMDISEVVGSETGDVETSGSSSVKILLRMAGDLW